MDELLELDALVEIEKYEYLFLGRLAIEKGFILYQQLLEALLIQHEIPEAKLGYLLLSLEYINQAQLNELLQEQKIFLESPPAQWPEIPDFVLKGLVYFGKEALGNVSGKELRKAQQIRNQLQKQGQKKSLVNILVEDTTTITKEELQTFQDKIQYKEHRCSKCSRIFHVFYYNPQERLRCPVCWTSYLQIIRQTARQAPKESLPQAPPPPAKKQRGPVASTQMIKFYELLQAENDKEEQASTAKETIPDARPKEKPQVVERKVAPRAEKAPLPVAPVPVAKEPELQKIQEVRIHAQEQLKKIYEQMEKQEEEAPKKKIVRSGILNTPRNEKEMKLWKVYKKTAIVLACFLGLLAIFLSYAFIATIPVEKPSYNPVPVAAQDTVQPGRDAVAPVKTIQNLDNPFVRDIIMAFSEGSAEPSHKHFNAILKKIHLEGQDMLKSPGAADLWNLVGRLYYYKIYIDREEGLFEENTKKIWQEEAREAFKKAKNIYNKEETLPLFILPVVSWMPERLFYQGKSFVRYENNSQAVEDMENWLKRTDM